MSSKNREREMRLRSASVGGYDPYDGLHAIARRECAKTGTTTSYPANFIEFHEVAGESSTARQSRMVLGLDLDTIRRHLAGSIPIGELTDPEMGSVTEYDSRYKADSAYARAIQAQAA